MTTFIILHYLVLEDTLDCIESIIKSYKKEKYNIVVVDNASNNGSLEEIEKKYSINKNIYFIKNKKNIGFAKGNNLGYKFAKNKLQSEFIVILNNDIKFEELYFEKKIHELYRKEEYYIMGPDIISTVDNYHQNPLKYTITKKEQLYRDLIRYSLLLTLNYLHFENFLSKIKNIFVKKQISILDESNYNTQKENIPLHGAFLVFSPLFIGKEDEAFYNETFLYLEEDILFYKCLKKKYKTMYSPEITVFHKEDSATNFMLANRNKRRFIYKNIIKSIYVFLKLIRGEKKI